MNLLRRTTPQSAGRTAPKDHGILGNYLGWLVTRNSAFLKFNSQKPLVEFYLSRGAETRRLLSRLYKHASDGDLRSLRKLQEAASFWEPPRAELACDYICKLATSKNRDAISALEYVYLDQSSLHSSNISQNSVARKALNTIYNLAEGHSEPALLSLLRMATSCPDEEQRSQALERLFLLTGPALNLPLEELKLCHIYLLSFLTKNARSYYVRKQAFLKLRRISKSNTPFSSSASNELTSLSQSSPSSHE
ncbi:hypothetical protein DRN67_01680 [Candidatus Micrarchaeota archaeon]|nr:MAG: hypothetical protein DRN67_01680 [Candidatus Micrarchaeota archaeon]